MFFIFVLKTGCNLGGLGEKGKVEKKGITKRKPMRYKNFRIVENFFGLKEQERDKRTEKNKIF